MGRLEVPRQRFDVFPHFKEAERVRVNEVLGDAELFASGFLAGGANHFGGGLYGMISPIGPNPDAAGDDKRALHLLSLIIGKAGGFLYRQSRLAP